VTKQWLITPVSNRFQGELRDKTTLHVGGIVNYMLEQIAAFNLRVKAE